MPVTQELRGARINKPVTLSRNWEFKRAYSKGRSFACPVLVCYCVNNRKSFTRIGIIAAKKVGGAVVRNRARRVIKEAYRQISPKIKPGWDIVFVARTGTPGCKSTQIATQMRALLKKAGAAE